MTLVTKSYLRLFAEFVGFALLAYLFISSDNAKYAVAALAAFAAFTRRSLSFAYSDLHQQERITQIMDGQLVQVSRFMEQYEQELPDMKDRIRRLEEEVEELKGAVERRTRS